MSTGDVGTQIVRANLSDQGFTAIAEKGSGLARALGCLLCQDPLAADEQQRVTCRRCQTRLGKALGELPELYRQLGAMLAPGSGAGGPAVSGTRDRALPVNEAALELRAWSGMVDALRAHEDDWRRALRLPLAPWRGSVEQTLTACAGWLGAHLWWACEKYPDVDGLDADVTKLHGAAMSVVDPDPRGRGVVLGNCPADVGGGEPCGALLRVRPADPQIICRWCLAEWPPSTWSGLKALMDQDAKVTADVA